MSSIRALALISITTLLLGACSLADEVLPSFGEDEAARQSEQVVIPASDAEQRDEAFYAEAGTEAGAEPQPVRSVTPVAFEPEPLKGVTPTGTFVGSKVAQQRAEMENLQNAVRGRQAQFDQLRNTARQNSQNYFATVAAITARLRVGTTPGNPVLISQWNAAQSELDRVLTDIAALSTLGNQVASDSAMSAYLINSIRATYGLQGAVDEDHRQLALIEDEINRTSVLIDRLLIEVQQTIGRYTEYVNAERRNLTSLALAIKNGEYIGPSLANTASNLAPAPTTSATEAEPVEPQALLSERRPLVVIRFDREDVEFRQALYTAISTALERRPQSTFDLVAVAPNKGSPADVALASNTSKRYAERVVQALTEMGLPSNRLTLSATTSPGALTNEVHIYVR